jgi:hypothetical protein
LFERLQDQDQCGGSSSHRFFFNSFGIKTPLTWCKGWVLEGKTWPEEAISLVDKTDIPWAWSDIQKTSNAICS